MNESQEDLTHMITREPAERSAHDQVATAIERVRSDVSAFDKIEAGIAKLQEQHPADLVVDVSTPAGMKVAIAARAAWRDPRVNLERVRKSAKAPVLELGRKIDAFAADIEARLRIGEANYDDQIKVEEQRKAAAKKAAEEAEAARVKQIQGRIAFHFTTKPMLATGKTANEITATIREIAEHEVTEVEFAEFAQDALSAKQSAELQLIAMRDAALVREQEAERARTIAEENERQRAELAAKQAAFEEEQRAHRAAVAEQMRQADEARAKERAERQAELDRIAAEQRRLDNAKREEADRIAAAERARLDAEAAERRRIADEEAAAERERAEKAIAEAAAAAEALRKQNEEKAAAEERKRQRAAKKLAQVQKCGPRLLDALKDLAQDCEANVPIGHIDKKMLAEAHAAIAEAEAE